MADLRAAAETSREFTYSDGRPPSALVESIRHAGVLTPLVVGPGGCLIHGARRLAAAAMLDLPEVPIAAAKDTRAAFLAGVWDNIAHRRFAALEIADLIARLRTVAAIDDAELTSRYLPALGLPAAATVLERYAMLAAVPAPVRAIAARGALRDGHVFLLCAMDADDALALAGLLAELSPSTGEARVLAEQLRACAARDGVTLSAVLCREVVSAIVHAGRPAARRIAELRALLRRTALPELSALEDEARRMLIAGGLSHPLDVRLPPDLEGDAIEVRFRATDLGTYARLADSLGRHEARRAIHAVLALLRGERE